MEWSNDPVVDAERYYAKREKEYAESYKCEHCGHVLKNKAYDINGSLLCDNCVDDIFGVDVDDL